MTSSKTVSSFAWSLFEQVGSKAVSLVVQIVLARLLAPEAFGMLAIMLVLVNVVDVIAQGGLGMALIQAPNVDDLSCTSAFWLSMAFAAFLYLLVFLVAPFVADFYFLSDLTLYLRVLSLVVFLNAANSVQRSILQREMDFKALFKSSTVAVFVSGVAGIAAALAGWGAWALVLQVMVAAAAACAAMAAQVPWRPSFSFDAARARSLFSYGWKMCAAGIVNTVYSGVSDLAVGKACSTVDLGYYSQGRKWTVTAVTVVTNSLQNVLFPAFSAMQGDPDRLRGAVRRAVAVGDFVIVPAAFFVAVAAEPIVALLLGEKWLPSVFVLQVTSIGYCVLMMQLVNLRAYMALGDSGLYLGLQVAKVLVTGPTVVGAAILTGDIYVTAAASSACMVFCIVAFDLQPAKRMHGVGRVEQLGLMVPPLTASLVAGAGAWVLACLPMPRVALLAAQIVEFAAVYLLLTATFKVEGGRECLQIAREFLSRGGLEA